MGLILGCFCLFVFGTCFELWVGMFATLFMVGLVRLMWFYLGYFALSLARVFVVAWC